MDRSLSILTPHASSSLSFSWRHMLFCALECQWNVCNAVRKPSSVWLSVCVGVVGLPGTVDSGRQQLQTPACSQASVSALRDIVIPTRPQQSSVCVVMGLRPSISQPEFWGTIMWVLHAGGTLEPNKGGGSSRFNDTNKDTLRLAVVLG